VAEEEGDRDCRRFRSLRVRLWFVGWGAGGLALAGATFGAVTGIRNLSWFAAIGAVAGIILGVLAASRLQLAVTTAGLTFSNGLWSRSVPWTTIEEVGIRYVGLPTGVEKRVSWWLLLGDGRHPPAIGVRTRDRVDLPTVWATALLPLGEREALVGILRDAADRHHFRVAVGPADLGV
jgi:hypothetical protein